MKLLKTCHPELADSGSLKELWLMAVEAINYINEFNQRIAIRRSKARQPGSPHHEPSAEPAAEVQDCVQDQERDKAAEEACVGISSLQVGDGGPSPIFGPPSSVLDKVLELFGQEAPSSTTLSKSVLAVVPHLADDEDTVFEDPYLGETQKCKMAYAGRNLYYQGPDSFVHVDSIVLVAQSSAPFTFSVLGVEY